MSAQDSPSDAIDQDPDGPGLESPEDVKVDSSTPLLGLGKEPQNHL